MFADMAVGWYQLWWREELSKNLTAEEKASLLKRLSEHSLKEAFYNAHPDTDYSEQYPELKPEHYCKEGHRHSSTLSGLMLYTVMKEIFQEVQESPEIREAYIRLDGGSG